MKTALLLVAVLTCAQRHQREVDQVVKIADTEVETQIMLLESPFGDLQHVRERERAAEWLTAHADRAYPKLLAMVRDGTAGPAAVTLLPAFGRPESVPALEALLGGPERIAWAAGQALAQHRVPEALMALRRAVRRHDTDAVVAAAGGLGASGDKASCPDLMVAVAHPDPRARYQGVQAAARLGCLTRQQIEALATGDPSQDVSALAADLLGRAR